MKTPSTLLLVVAVAGAAFAQDQATPQPAEDINPQVLTVNGEPVYAAEISLVMRTVAESLKAGSAQPSQKEILGAATQRVIEQKLLAQEARRFGLHADESEVENLLNAAATQLGGREELAAWLAKGGSSIDQLTRIYREVDVGRVFVAKQIRPTVQVTDQEVDELIAKHPELSKATSGDAPGEALPPEEARQRARALLVNQKTGKLVSDLLKTLYDEATIQYADAPAVGGGSTAPSEPAGDAKP